MGVIARLEFPKSLVFMPDNCRARCAYAHFSFSNLCGCRRSVADPLLFLSRSSKETFSRRMGHWDKIQGVTGDSMTNQIPHKRRPRYAGKNPRRFAEKYKEHDPARYAETVAKVIASGKTPAGTHRPVMITEI